MATCRFALLEELKAPARESLPDGVTNPHND